MTKKKQLKLEGAKGHHVIWNHRPIVCDEPKWSPNWYSVDWPNNNCLEFFDMLAYNYHNVPSCHMALCNNLIQHTSFKFWKLVFKTRGQEILDPKMCAIDFPHKVTPREAICKEKKLKKSRLVGSLILSSTKILLQNPWKSSDLEYLMQTQYLYMFVFTLFHVN
jgi:hypothetical protein